MKEDDDVSEVADGRGDEVVYWGRWERMESSTVTTKTKMWTNIQLMIQKMIVSASRVRAGLVTRRKK